MTGITNYYKKCNCFIFNEIITNTIKAEN